MPTTQTQDTGDKYDQYYTGKTNPIKSDVMKVPKTEITSSSSCCSVSAGTQNELLVPKTEITSSSSSCRSPPPSSGIRSGYEPYMNQDSNSSSLSSMETIRGPPPQHQVHHMGPHGGSQTGYNNLEHNQIPHRSPYHHPSPMSDEMYHRSDRSYTDMNDSMSGSGGNGTGIARPVVTYSNDIVNRSYDSSINSANHRPYDPGTNSFDRYDSSQCVSLQQPLGPPRVPPQGMYGYSSLEEQQQQQEQRYQQEAAAVAAAQHHQIAVANSQNLMKSEEQESTGPLYPR